MLRAASLADSRGSRGSKLEARLSVGRRCRDGNARERARECPRATSQRGRAPVGTREPCVTSARSSVESRDSTLESGTNRSRALTSQSVGVLRRALDHALALKLATPQPAARSGSGSAKSQMNEAIKRESICVGGQLTWQRQNRQRFASQFVLWARVYFVQLNRRLVSAPRLGATKSATEFRSGLQKPESWLQNDDNDNQTD